MTSTTTQTPSTDAGTETIPMAQDDKTAIIEVLNLYGFALDAQQWDLFDDVFSKDVIAEFGPAGNAWTGLETFKKSFAMFHEQLDNHQHTMMGHLVHVEGDTAYAFSYGNWLLVRDAAEGGPQWTGTGWYDDLLVRGADGWRIRHRVCRLVSWTGNPSVPVAGGDHAPDHTTHVLREACEAGEIRYLKALRASREAS